MIRIICPACQAEYELDSVRRSATEFCTAPRPGSRNGEKCDFPLFWVRADVPLEDDGSIADESRRRLPGAGGRVTIGSRPCPHCNELNSVAAINCTRCGGLMDPPPPPEPEPEPLPEPEPIVVIAAPPPPPPAPLWPLWAAFATGLAGFLVYLLIVT